MGGAVKAIEQGYIQREIAESSYQYQRQVESGEQIVAGVNKFTIEEPPAKGLLHIDASVAANQIKKLQEMKAARDNVLVRQRLDALRTAAEGSDNLMPIFWTAPGCTAPKEKSAASCARCSANTVRWRCFEMSEKKIRVPIAKPGLDGHDRGAKAAARVLRDAGFEVIYTGLRQTPEQIVEAAVSEDVDAVGLSLLSGAHNYLFPRVIELLKEQEADGILVFGGGVIPEDDIPELKKAGVSEVFTPGTPTAETVKFLQDHCGARDDG